jgi:hypothetical protein
MVIQIRRREVLSNIIRFKDNLLEKRKEKRLKIPERRIYLSLLNRHTGDMRFAEKISTLEHHIQNKPGQSKKRASFEDWKEILLTAEEKDGHVHFEVLEGSGAELKSKEIDPIAWRIASETLAVLNAMGEAYREMGLDLLPEDAALADLSEIKWTPVTGQIESMAGWQGKMGRIEAEQKLQHKAVGTYLFREADELDRSIAFHLAKENQIQIHFYLLTVVEEEAKISDKLILYSERGWTLYNDEPDLDSLVYHYYPTIEALLESMKSSAKKPL